MFARYNTIDVEDAQNAVDQLGLYLGNLDQSLDQEGSRE
jgi:hypothetical protein